MRSRIKIALLFFVVLLNVGTFGYWAIEGWSPLDSLYMTVITLSTVGFRELAPLSATGKLFTCALILVGVGTLAYTATKTTEALLERGVFYRRRMQMDIKRLRGHVIVCGYGRMGQTVCDQLHKRKVRAVVIEKDPHAAEVLAAAGLLHVIGDATEDESLVAAGVERARALAILLPHDADNLFVTLSARGLRPELFILARCSDEKNQSKMVAAGAARVLNPYSDGGRLAVRQILHPSVTLFMDVISDAADTALSIEEVRLGSDSALTGVPLRDAPIRSELDIIVIGVRRSEGGDLIFNPPSDLAPEAGDVLVVLGNSDNLRQLELMAGRGT